VDICPQLDCSSPEPVMCASDVGLCFCYACCHCEKRPHDSLSSYSLDPVDGSHKFVFEGVHLDIGGVVYRQRNC
jgi:hypothetical protein